MQVIKTDNGYVSGAVIGDPGREVSIFRGIPYAAPPVGPLRWKPPQPAAPWQGIRECTAFTGISPQNNQDPTIARLARTEDCLYLNVLTPAESSRSKLPVMVWMHGGAYFAGCGNDPIWNLPRLPQQGVVLVTVNHRLGPIGLVAHPEISKESPEGVSGNYLFLDLIASLKWIQNNIAAFGGDPRNVTIFGESGGGAKVAMMMVSPLARGLFHRAICESGTAEGVSPGKPLKEMENYGIKLFEKLGVKTLREARDVPWEKIIAADSVMETSPGPSKAFPLPIWDSAIDGWVLKDSPMKLFEDGVVNPVPLIVCANHGEIVGPNPFEIPFLIQSYRKMLEAVTKNGMPGYAALFNRVPAHWRQAGVVAFHAIELPYIFGDWDNSTGWWDVISHSMQFGSSKTKDVILDADDKHVSEIMGGLWTSFAKNGKPKAKGVADWPAYDKTGDNYLYISEKPVVKTGYSKLPKE
jgi:para-nitrobenzyl esterase